MSIKVYETSCFAVILLLVELMQYQARRRGYVQQEAIGRSLLLFPTLFFIFLIFFLKSETKLKIHNSIRICPCKGSKKELYFEESRDIYSLQDR